jgi:hypothetical protein
MVFFSILPICSNEREAFPFKGVAEVVEAIAEAVQDPLC